MSTQSNATGRPRLVVALGGNALLRRGEPLEAANQVRAAQIAGTALAAVTASSQLIVTHGNGPQVGLLALISDAYTATTPYRLDVLGSETEGQIGYTLELALDNATGGDWQTVTVLTRVVVDPDDPAFSAPSKFIGPVYNETEARALAGRRDWTVAQDGDRWRRVVASPQPRRIVQRDAIERLVDAGFLVICTGGGGIPVVEDDEGRQRGVEAVIDKDLASSLLAEDLRADVLILATDVQSVYAGYHTATERAIGRTTPTELRALRFAGGSMAPKVEAACRFVERTGGRAVIGALADIPELLEGRCGTQVLPSGTERHPTQRRIDHVRAA